MRLAILASHPIQYQVPIFRKLAKEVDITVFYAHRATPADQAKAGFAVAFDWDIDLLSGYRSAFLRNAARQPGLDHFSGCDTPEIRTVLAKGGFQALLVMGWHLKTFLQAIFAAKYYGIPVFVRGDSQLNTPRHQLKKTVKALVYPQFLGLFDGALYVGERSRAYWSYYRYPEKRLFFSPHCVDNEWFSVRATRESGYKLREQCKVSEDTCVILFAGKLVPIKRPIDVIFAAARLKHADVKIAVFVAGGGPLEGEMTAAAKSEGITLHQLGFRNQTEMPAVYAASNVLVLPGQETWGLVANEALACGKPIIVSDAAGCAPDLAADGKAGRIFRVGEIADLARELMETFANPAKPEAIVTKCTKYSVENAVSGIVAALTSELSVRRPS